VTAAGTFAAAGAQPTASGRRALPAGSAPFEITPAGADACGEGAQRPRYWPIKFLGDVTRIDLAVEGFEQIAQGPRRRHRGA
jgi:hypothetical protein